MRPQHPDERGRKLKRGALLQRSVPGAFHVHVNEKRANVGGKIAVRAVMLHALRGGAEGPCRDSRRGSSWSRSSALEQDSQEFERNALLFVRKQAATATV